MGGRGTPSRSGRSVVSTTRKNDSTGAAESFVKKSVKSVTKGMTKSVLNRMTRRELESVSILQTAKNYMKQFKLSASEAIRRSKLMVPQQTTAQLRKSVWKYRNMD